MARTGRDGTRAQARDRPGGRADAGGEVRAARARRPVHATAVAQRPGHRRDLSAVSLPALRPRAIPAPGPARKGRPRCRIGPPRMAGAGGRGGRDRRGEATVPRPKRRILPRPAPRSRRCRESRRRRPTRRSRPPCRRSGRRARPPPDGRCRGPPRRGNWPLRRERLRRPGTPRRRPAPGRHDPLRPDRGGPDRHGVAHFRSLTSACARRLKEAPGTARCAHPSGSTRDGDPFAFLRRPLLDSGIPTCAEDRQGGRRSSRRDGRPGSAFVGEPPTDPPRRTPGSRRVRITSFDFHAGARPETEG